jgi:hypothetical protein
MHEQWSPVHTGINFIEAPQAPKHIFQIALGFRALVPPLMTELQAKRMCMVNGLRQMHRRLLGAIRSFAVQ